MRDQSNWSLSLGRWGGVHVSLHAVFLLFALLVLFLAPHRSSDPNIAWIVAAGLGVLLVSVLLHEIAHAYVAYRLGGQISQTTIMPWGGMNSVTPPGDAHSEIVIYLVGPLLHLVICLLCMPALLALDNVDVIALLHPLGTASIAEGAWWAWTTKLVFWINWLLFLTNLIPTFPFDGGFALRARLARIWSRFGQRQAGLAIGRAARIAALGLCVVAWLTRDLPDEGIVPAWFALGVVAIVLFFSAYTVQDHRVDERRRESDLFGYDFSQGYTSLERSSEYLDDDGEAGDSGPISQWLEKRRQARDQREKEIEAEDERRVDDILARLHAGGIESLSEEDRAILDRVSARYRNRLGDHA